MSTEPSNLDISDAAAAAVAINDPAIGLAGHWRAARSSDFVRKVAETYATRIVLVGIGLATTIIVSRLLGPEGRGYYAVAAATGTLGVQFGNLGLHTSNVYFAAREPRSLPSLTGNSLVVSLGFGGLFSAVLAIIFLLAPGLISLRGPLLMLALVWIPFGLAYLLLQDLLLGLQDIRGYNLLELASKALPLLLMGAILLLRRVSVTNFLAATVAGLIACAGLSLQRVRSSFTGWPKPSLVLFRSSFQYAVKAYLATFFAFLVLRADLFMVQHMLGPEQAGYYSIAASMADTVSMLAVVIGTILFPKLSALTDIKTKLHLTYKASWGTAGALLPILALAALSAKWALRLLFGTAFLPSSPAFVLLMPGMLFLGVEAVAVQFLNSIGFPGIVVAIWALCTGFNIAVNLWAIPRYGIAGASVVSSISYFLAFVLIVSVIRRVGGRYASEGSV